MPLSRWLLGTLCLFSISCGSGGNRTDQPPGHWIEHSEREFPARLSEVGLWALPESQPIWSAEVDPRALTFAPQFPLWTNGARKQRQLILPEGELLDAAEPANWRVPPGTIAFKTLFFANESGDSIPTETRVIHLGEDGARRFAVYVWNGELADAERVESGASIEVRDFAGNRLEHRVPSEDECSACHDSSPQALLSLNAFQQQPADEGALPTSAFEAAPGLPSPGLRDDEVESRVLGYFVGNCSHCHNDWHGPNSEFSLLPEDAFDNLIGVESQGSASTDGVRVIPGDPDNSLLIQAMGSVQGARRAKPMPPLGVQVADTSGMTLIEDWIENLEHDD